MEVAEVEDEDLLPGRVRLPEEVHLPMVHDAVPDLVNEPVAPKMPRSVEVSGVDVLVLRGQRFSLLQRHLPRQVDVLRREPTGRDPAVDRLLRAVDPAAVRDDHVMDALAVDHHALVDDLVEFAELGLVHVHAGP